MLSNSTKYAINAGLYLALHSSVENKKGVKEISEVLHIPTAFLAKLLQILAKKNAICSSKGPGGGFYLTEEKMKAPLANIVHHIDGVDKFSLCILGIRPCSEETPCPMHYAVKPFKEEFLRELEKHDIEYFADKIRKGEAYLIV